MAHALRITKERILSKIKAVESPLGTPCWEWQGTRSKHGYGSLFSANKRWLAHRASYYAFVEPITEKDLILHKCDNPPCVNPEHLYIGTQAENVRDCIARRRHNYGSRNGQAKLSDEQVLQIRAMLETRKMRHKDIAEKFGVSIWTTILIKQGRRWKHLIGADSNG